MVTTATHNHKKKILKATVMDTATASLENKPLKETEGPLDDAFPVPGYNQLAAAMKRKTRKKIG